MATTAMASSPKFWDKIAKKYARQPVPDQSVYEKKLDITREYFRPDMQVLEFGGGTGTTAILHAPYVKHILATDISSKMLEIAEQKARDQQVSNVTFQRASVEGFQAENESFDAILTLSLLHLLKNKEAALAKIKRLLKPGGVFVSSTVCIGGRLHFFRIIGPVGHALGFFPLVRFFSKQELLDSIKKAGFRIEYEWQPDNSKAVFFVARKPE